MPRSARGDVHGSGVPAAGAPRGREAVLTRREREVLELVADGLTNAQVAAVLWIAPGTVRRHLENIYGKLGVHNRTGAAASLRHGSRIVTATSSVSSAAPL